MSRPSHRGVVLAGLLALTLSSGEASALEYARVGTVVELSGAWLWHGGDNPSFSRPTLDDYQWQERRLPAEASAWAARWEGRAWMRLHVIVDPAVADQDLMLALGHVGEAAEVYLNGSLIGTHGSLWGSGRSGPRARVFTAMVPSGLLHEGDNVIALRVYDPTYAGGVRSGPLLLGPPDAVQELIAPRELRIVGVRTLLGGGALFIGLGQLALLFRRRSGREIGWLVLAGVALGAVLLSGVGLFDHLIPSAALAARLPLVLGPIAVLGLGSHFAHRYGEALSRRVRIGQLLLLGLSALSLLAWEVVVYFVAEPGMFIGALAVTLYGAHIAAQAARRRDPTASWLFAALAVETFLIVYDGLSAMSGSAAPPTSFLGAVGVMFVSSIAHAREAAREQDDVLIRMLAAKRRLEDRMVSLLDAASLTASEVDNYLSSLINEITAELDVRRCSLMLLQPDGSLRIRTSVGLPRHATDRPIDVQKSIGGWVFTSGKPATSNNIPQGLSLGRKGGAYLSEAFVSHPLVIDGQVAGVLNCSDPHRSQALTPADENRVAVLAGKLSTALSRVPRDAWVPPERPAKVVRRIEGPAPKAKEAGEPAVEIERNDQTPSPPPEMMVGPLASEVPQTRTAPAEIIVQPDATVQIVTGFATIEPDAGDLPDVEPGSNEPGRG